MVVMIKVVVAAAAAVTMVEVVIAATACLRNDLFRRVCNLISAKFKCASIFCFGLRANQPSFASSSIFLRLRPLVFIRSVSTLNA